MLIQLSNSLISGLFVTITNIFWTVTSLTVINAPLSYSNYFCPRNNAFALKRTSRFWNLNWWCCYRRRCSWWYCCYWCGRFCCGTNKRSHVFIGTCTENKKETLLISFCNCFSVSFISHQLGLKYPNLRISEPPSNKF